MGDLQDAVARELWETYVFERQAYEAMLLKEHQIRKRRMPRALDEHMSQEYVEQGDPKESVWLKIARTLFSERIDPVDYVRRIFAAIAAHYGWPPLPNQLLSSRNRERYAKSLAGEKQDLSLALHNQKSYARQAVLETCAVADISADEAMMQVLYNESLPLSSLFRCCLGYNAGVSGRRKFFNVSKQYWVGAALQYERSKVAYDAAWGDFIPDELKTKASAIYTLVLNTLCDTGD